MGLVVLVYRRQWGAVSAIIAGIMQRVLVIQYAEHPAPHSLDAGVNPPHLPRSIESYVPAEALREKFLVQETSWVPLLIDQ
jgi:hypothetical protein